MGTMWAAKANMSVVELREHLRLGKEARETIVSRNLGIVFGAVKYVQRDYDGLLTARYNGTTEADLIQKGCLGLLRAAERFNVTRNHFFGRFAVLTVRKAIDRTFQETRGEEPAGLLSDHRKVASSMQRLIERGKD